MRGNAFRRWLTAVLVWALAWTTVAPPPALAGGLAAIDAYHVGRHHLANGEHAKALEAFNDALRMNPQFVQAYVARGKLLAEMGQFPSALADLNFALHLQPTHAEGFAYRGFALLSMNRPDEALADLDNALRLDPRYARVHYLRSQTLRDLGNESEAKVSLATALELDPTIEARQVVAAIHEAGDEEGRIALASLVPPERTSVLATAEAAPPPDKRKMGNVVRHENHPFLKNLEPPAISQPRYPRVTDSVVQPRVGDRRATSFPLPAKSAAGAVMPHVTDSAQSSTEKTEENASAATDAPMEIPQLDASAANAGPNSPEAVANTAPAAAATSLIPLPATGAATAVATTPLPTVEIPVVEMPANAGVAAAESVAIPNAPGFVEIPIESIPYVVGDVQATASASAILADPALAERLSPARAAPTESDRLAAALDAARQAALDRPTVVMSTQASPGGPVDMPVIEDMPGGQDMPVVSDESAPTPVAIAPPAVEAPTPAPIVVQALPIAAEGAVAMASDAPAIAVETLIPPPAAPQVAETPVVAPAAAPEFDVETKIALSRLDESLRQNPGDIRLRLIRGNLLLNHNAFEAASADFDEALKIDPAQFDARYGRARACYLSGRYADAIDDFTAVLTADDQHAAALLERGHCLALLGNTTDADRDRNAALALDPSLAKTGPKYGGSFAAQPPATVTAVQTSAFNNLFPGQNAGAAPQPAPAENAAFVSDSSQPSAAEVVHAYVGDEVTPDNGIREISAQIAATPGNPMLYVRRAQALSSAGRHQEAVDDLTAALRIDPECNLAIVMRARAYEALGLTAEAQADRQRADSLMSPQ